MICVLLDPFKKVTIAFFIAISTMKSGFSFSFESIEQFTLQITKAGMAHGKTHKKRKEVAISSVTLNEERLFIKESRDMMDHV